MHLRSKLTSEICSKGGLDGWLVVGCRVYGRSSHEGPRTMGGMPSVGIFLRDPRTIISLNKQFRKFIERNISLYNNNVEDED